MKSISAASIEQNQPEKAEENRQNQFATTDSEKIEANEIAQQSTGVFDPNNAGAIANEIEVDTNAGIKASSEDMRASPPFSQDAAEVRVEDSAPKPVIEESPGLRTRLKNNFSIAEHGIRVALFVVSVAVTVVACIGLVTSWKDLDETSKWLDTASVIQQGLSAIIEGTTLVLDTIDVTTGLLGSICAWAGPVLALIGLALMVAMLIWQSKQRPPPNADRRLDPKHWARRGKTSDRSSTPAA